MIPDYQILQLSINSVEGSHLRDLITPCVSAKFHCTNVEQLADVLCLLKEQKTHLVLLNLGSPAPDALDSLRNIRLTAPRIPVVVFAEAEDQASIAAATKIGIDDYLIKRRTTSDLLSRVMVHVIERNTYQDCLKFSERHILQETIDTMAANVAVLDHNGDILAVNHAWQSCAGKNGVRLKESVIGTSYLEMLGQVCGMDEKEAIVLGDGIRAVMGGMRQSFGMEHSCPAPQKECWVYTRVATYPGTKSKVMVTHEDITARKLMKKALQDNEERFRSVTDASPNCVFITDSQGRYVHVNQSLANLYGISKQEIIGKLESELPCKCFTKTEKSSAPFIGNNYEMEIDNGAHSFRISHSYSLPNGSTRWFSVIKRPIEFPGTLGSSVNVAIDITELCKAEEDYRNLELRMQTILDVQKNRMVLVDPQMQVLWPNRKACDEAGLPRDKIIGQSCYRLWENRLEPCEVCPTIQALEKGEAFSEKRTTADGCTLRIHGFPVRSATGKIISAVEVVEDITERVTLEGQLRQAQKMESLGTLAGGIAHDFNNILTGILGYAELALEKTKESTAVKNYLHEVYRAGLRAKELTQQILTFSRRADFEVAPLQVETIIQEALKLLRSSLPTSITIQTKISKKLDMVLADSTHIHQIVMNLCTNAAHAMEPHGGVLGLELTQIEIDSGSTGISDRLEPGRYLQLSVSDTGCGMSPEIIGSIFDPYFSTKDPGEGTGLGLAVIHGIINEYGGDITVDSIPGKGTIFNLFFPTVKTKSTDSAQCEIEPLPGGSERILVVDDEPVILKLCKRILEQQGYTVITENDSLQALERFCKNPNGFDLVLSDVTMPRLTGDQLIIKIQAIRPDIPVILCTGYSRVVSEQSALGVGAAALLQKPVVKKQLLSKIRMILDHKAGPCKQSEITCLN